MPNRCAAPSADAMILSVITTQVYLVVYGLMFALRTPSWKQELAADRLAAEA
nr:hypothetical protein [Rhodococcus wratislaviensis]GLK36904.1 hypothetical protein GCM10017611_37610 [Rhodococcus wratislaviensis]